MLLLKKCGFFPDNNFKEFDFSKHMDNIQVSETNGIFI